MLGGGPKPASGPAMLPFDQEMLNRFGPASKPIPLPGLNIPDYVREQFMASEQAPQPSRMDQVYDNFMNDQLRVPMNVKALAGIHPLVASRFLEQQGGLQQFNRAYGSTPEERERRNRLMAATQLGGQHLQAQAAMADSTARQNVGMRAGDAEVLSGIHGNVSRRYDAEQERIASAGRLKTEQDFATAADARAAAREQRRHEETRADTQRTGMYTAVQSMATAEMARIDAAEKRAIDEVSRARKAGYIPTEHAADQMIADISAQYDTERGAIRSELGKTALSYQSGGKIDALTPRTLPSLPNINKSFEAAKFRKMLEDAGSQAQGGWSLHGGMPWKVSEVQSLKERLPKKFLTDPQLRQMLTDYIAESKLTGDVNARRPTLLDLDAMNPMTAPVNLIPGYGAAKQQIAEFMGLD